MHTSTSLSPAELKEFAYITILNVHSYIDVHVKQYIQIQEQRGGGIFNVFMPVALKKGEII